MTITQSATAEQRWDGEPANREPAKCSGLLWADPDNLPALMAPYAAAAITASWRAPPSRSTAWDQPVSYRTGMRQARGHRKKGSRRLATASAPMLKLHLAHLSRDDVRVARMKDRPWRHIELRVCPELTTVGAPHDHPAWMITLDLGSSLALYVVILARCGGHYADRTGETTGMRTQIRATSSFAR
jgi:hypothetical protein